jgi:hypothetical protein
VVEQGDEEVLDGGILQVDGQSSVGVLEGFIVAEKNVRPEVDGVGAIAERNQEREKRAAALQGTGKLCA